VPAPQDLDTLYQQSAQLDSLYSRTNAPNRGISQAPAPSLASDLGFGQNDYFGIPKLAQGIVDIPDALLNSVFHPIQTFYDAPRQEMDKAQQFANQGDVYNSMVHSVAAAVPFGSAGAAIGERFGGKETPRALGNIAGAAASGPLFNKMGTAAEARLNSAIPAPRGVPITANVPVKSDIVDSTDHYDCPILPCNR